MSDSSVGGTSDRWLQPGVAIRKVYEIAEPNLIFPEFIDGPIQEDRSAFPYIYDSTGISSDTKKQTAPRYMVGADLPRLDFSLPSTSSAVTSAKGFEIAVPRTVVRDGVLGQAAKQRYLTRAGYVIAEQINTAILAAMTSGASGTTTVFAASVAAGGVWSGDGATPVKDLEGLAQDMDVEGYPYRLTDVFVNKAGFYELKNYLNFIDNPKMDRDVPYGQMINRDTIYVSMADVTVHKVMSGMTDSYVLGLDKNNPGAEMHTFIDPLFSMTGKTVTYPTVESGKKVYKTVPNLGIHYYEYMENDTKETIMQFWFDNKTVVTKASALQYVAGI